MIQRFLLAFLMWIGAGVRCHADDKQVKELAKLDGTWTLVKMEVEGKSLLDKEKPLPKLVIKHGRAAFAGQGAPTGEEVVFAKVLDLSKEPKAVTVPYEGKVTFYGIYEVEGDELRVCGDGVDLATEKNPEARRPKRFDSKEGLLLVFKREKG